ncbi:uncharacterized protein LOC122670394 [Telopea speciosissima]|uniref:uncharacterized protein LOC122670394 n=1 Tax=Telopea speciosissima TaxID=54955 RepID=UPI001CC57010|nr:uncharacterized protein LOC122670394 [Telopea speciosissima]
MQTIRFDFNPKLCFRWCLFTPSMEASQAATFKTVNLLTAFASRRATNPTTSIPPGPSSRQTMLGLCAASGTNTTCLNPNPKHHFSFLTRCSTKPDIDSDNTTNENPIVDTAPNSNTLQVQPSASPSNQTNSYSPSRGLVFDLGTGSSWDSQEIGYPVVKRYLSDDDERWFMWYHGSSDAIPSSDSIGLAVSSNGIHWERGAGAVRSSTETGMVMNCSKDWWAFDTESVRPSDVVIMSSTKVRASSAVYWLYYTGFSSEKVEISGVHQLLEENQRGTDRDERGGVTHVSRSLPGLAISQDGRHWARIEGEHHSGALFDVGTNAEWDSLFVATPRVVFHSNGDLRMYYHSFDANCGQFALGIARSRDGIRWVKLGKILGGGPKGSFDELGVMNAHVVGNRKDGGYVMAYEGLSADGQRSIGLAVSPDGLKGWERYSERAIFGPSVEQDGWDNQGVGSPCLVQMDGDAEDWRLYYKGIGKGGRSGIGLAVSEGSGFRRFRRWTGFHL